MTGQLLPNQIADLDLDLDLGLGFIGIGNTPHTHAKEVCVLKIISYDCSIDSKYTEGNSKVDVSG